MLLKYKAYIRLLLQLIAVATWPIVLFYMSVRLRSYKALNIIQHVPCELQPKVPNFKADLVKAMQVLCGANESSLDNLSSFMLNHANTKEFQYQFFISIYHHLYGMPNPMRWASLVMLLLHVIVWYVSDESTLTSLLQVHEQQFLQEQFYRSNFPRSNFPSSSYFEDNIKYPF